MEEELNGEVFITADGKRLVYQPKSFLVLERIWRPDQILSQKYHEMITGVISEMSFKMLIIESVIDVREQEYDRRLVVDGEKLAKEWLENEKRNSTLEKDILDILRETNNELLELEKWRQMNR